jgi:HEAT repeat protein
VPQIRKSIKSPVSQVRENAIDAIMRMGPAGDAAIPELEVALTDPFARVRYVAAQAIVERKPEHVAARESLIEMLDDEELCPHAMTGLWYVGKHGTKAIPKLEAIIEKGDPYLRIRAAVTLWIVHPDSEIAPAVVREMLEHKDYEVRGSAAALVGRVGANAEPILDLLRTMLHDEDGSVQTWAKGSVEQIEAALKQSRAGESTKQLRWWHFHELMLAKLAGASQLNGYYRCWAVEKGPQSHKWEAVRAPSTMC